MDLEKVFNIVTDRRIWISLIILVIILTLVKISGRLFKRKIKKLEEVQNPNNKKRRTYLNLTKHIINYTIIILGIIFILQINGINVSSIFAGVGIVSIITGLALQDALKDIIMGFNIIVDNYFSVGDVIKIGEVEGKIVSFGLKSTKLKDINNGNMLVIANRNIDRALNISTQLDIDIPLEYEEDINKIEQVLNEIVEESKNNNEIIDIKYVGVNEFGKSAIYYKLRIWCNPEVKPIIKRYVNRIIKIKLEDYNITIPYTQIDIRTKDIAKNII